MLLESSTVTHNVCSILRETALRLVLVRISSPPENILIFPHRNTMDVLIVEDNRDAAESLMELLEAVGCQVSIAASGEEGLKFYRRKKFGLVFMDLKMPGIGGATATQEIFHLDSNAKVIIVTANPIKNEISELEKIPVLAVLRKPFDPKIVLEMVKFESSQLNCSSN